MSEIIPKVLVELPYVDRFPDHTQRPDQRRIQWIKNGDCLGAAEHENDNSGQLNRGPVQVQKNAETLLTNEKILHSSLDEVITRVNAHDVTLGDIGDDNLANKVEEIGLLIAPIPAEILALKQEDFLINDEIDNINLRVGNREPSKDSTTLNVMQDLLFVKTQIGNYQGYDINGIPNADVTDPTGIRRDIIAQGRTIGSNTSRIKTIEDNWVASDVGNLQADILEMRTELGEEGTQPKPNVYRWSKIVDSTIAVSITDIAEIRATIGDATGETIDTRITKTEENIESNTASIVTNTSDITVIKGEIGTSGTVGSLMQRVESNENNISTLQQVVGSDMNSGLQSLVQKNIIAIGSESQHGSMMFGIKTNETNVAEAQRSVATFSNQVGVSTAGQETGLYGRVVAVEASSKAPDDKVYGRKGSDWVDIANAGISEAPTDGKQYVRSYDLSVGVSGIWQALGTKSIMLAETKSLMGVKQDGSHMQLVSFTDDSVHVGGTTLKAVLGADSKMMQADGTQNRILTSKDFQDAPSDGKLYGRQNGAWVEIVIPTTPQP